MALLSFHYLLFIGFLLLSIVLVRDNDMANASSLMITAKPGSDSDADYEMTESSTSAEKPQGDSPLVIINEIGDSEAERPYAGQPRKKWRKQSISSFHSLGLLKYDEKTLIPPLPKEWPDPELDPKPHNLIKDRLFALLADRFDRNYMSIEQPRESVEYPEGRLEYKFRKNQTPEGQEVPSEIKALQGEDIKLAEDGLTLKIKFSRRTRQKLQKFLWAYSYCPVRYRWKKLSVRHWPRWVKEGQCDNSRSCSIPAGMTCQQSKTVTVTILRFLCQFKSGRRECRWYTMKYPILSECTCGCR